MSFMLGGRGGGGVWPGMVVGSANLLRVLGFRDQAVL